jgi:hypothetical protein
MGWKSSTLESDNRKPTTHFKIRRLFFGTLETIVAAEGENAERFDKTGHSGGRVMKTQRIRQRVESV